MKADVQGARMALRRLTAEAHERVDAGFGRFDLGTAGGYAAFLRAQAAAHLPVEAALDAAGAERVVGDWPARRRAAALRADLRALGAATPELLPAPAFDSPAAILGGVYVLEGSRLGGAMLARSVDPAFPCGFLKPGQSPTWRALIVTLDDSLRTDEDIGVAVCAAKAVFSLFGQAAAVK